MSLRRYIWKVKDSASDPAAKPPCYWVVDAESELPTIAHEGCLAYAKDTDSLYRCVSVGTWEAIEGGGGPATWGSIAGTLSGQTDLQTALDAKADSSHAHSISDTTGLQTALNGKCASDDARLSDARAPLAHSITSAHNGFPGGTSTFLRADGSFASPGGGAGADPPEGSYAPGSYTIATGKFRTACKRQQFTSTQRLTVQGTGRLSLSN